MSSPRRSVRRPVREATGCPWAVLAEVRVHEAQCEASRLLGRALNEAELGQIAAGLGEQLATSLSALVSSISEPS